MFPRFAISVLSKSVFLLQGCQMVSSHSFCGWDWANNKAHRKLAKLETQFAASWNQRQDNQDSLLHPLTLQTGDLYTNTTQCQAPCHHAQLVQFCDPSMISDITKNKRYGWIPAKSWCDNMITVRPAKTCCKWLSLRTGLECHKQWPLDLLQAAWFLLGVSFESFITTVPRRRVNNGAHMCRIKVSNTLKHSTCTSQVRTITPSQPDAQDDKSNAL